MKPLGIDFKYWAFICYAPEDAEWAIWLHKTLEHFRMPGVLQGLPAPCGTVPKRLRPVYIDSEGSPQSPGAGKRIEHALRESRSLVVICSPAGLSSPQVDHRIRYFKSLGRANEVLCVITDRKTDGPSAGNQQLVELIPQAARFEVDSRQQLTVSPATPLIADSRAEFLGRKDAVIKLVAGILGFDYEDLDRDVSRERQRWRLVWVSTSVLVIGLCALSMEVHLMKKKTLQARQEEQTHRELANAARKRATQAHQETAEAKHRAKESQTNNTPAVIAPKTKSSISD